MRIIHFEDEWAKSRSVAHRLHDRVFSHLPLELAVELDLSESENPNNDIPSKITASLKGTVTKVIFEYVFVANLSALASIAGSDDVVVVDIMRSDQRGRFVSNATDVRSLFKDRGFPSNQWRYFSAYPDEIPPDFELQGYSKRDYNKLIDYLFKHLLERKPWA